MSNDRTAEILQYLSAMSRDIGDFRAQMNARIDELQAETNKRIDELRAEMNARFNEVNTRFDKADREQKQIVRKLVRIEALTMNLRADSEETQERVEALEEKAGIEFVRSGV